MTQLENSSIPPLPKWESFQIQTSESANDFPAGPYYRMLARIYGTNNPLLAYKDRSKEFNSVKLPIPNYLGGRPSEVISESKVTHFSANSQSTIQTSKTAECHNLGSKASWNHGSALSENKPGSAHVPDVNTKTSTKSITVSKPEINFPESSRSSTKGALVDHVKTAGSWKDELKEKLTTVAEDSRFGDVNSRNINSIGNLVPSEKHQNNAEVPAKVKDFVGSPAGVIFFCNARTKPICFQNSLFGLPASQSSLVKRIVPGTKLFLFVIDTRELHGLFEATTHGFMNPDRQPFNGAFPSQVRFQTLKEYWPLAEAEFKDAIKDNYYASRKFGSELNYEQVSGLLKLFEQKLGSINAPHSNISRTVSGASGLDAADNQSEKSMEISSPQTSPLHTAPNFSAVESGTCSILPDGHLGPYETSAAHQAALDGISNAFHKGHFERSNSYFDGKDYMSCPGISTRPYSLPVGDSSLQVSYRSGSGQNPAIMDARRSDTQTTRYVEVSDRLGYYDLRKGSTRDSDALLQDAQYHARDYSIYNANTFRPNENYDPFSDTNEHGVRSSKRLGREYEDSCSSYPLKRYEYQRM